MSRKVTEEKRRICYNCAEPIDDDKIYSCPNCGASDIDKRRARPKRTGRIESVPLPMPWDELQLPPGGTVLLSGNRGSGKTSICMAMRPDVYMSSEQEPRPVASTWYRIWPEAETCPIITQVSSVEELYEDLITLSNGDLGVVDSISQIEPGRHSAEILEEAIRHIGRVGARCVFIAQYTKDGDMLGPNMLAHLVDVYCKIPDDPTGLRRLSTIKNRYGDLFTKYFSLGPNGVREQRFPHVYSVEGSAGNYHLHLYPLGGAKLAGILDVLTKEKIRVPGTASAAISSDAYEEGFVEPDDAIGRQKFAEQHGLRWLSPRQATLLLEEAAAREIEGGRE